MHSGASFVHGRPRSAKSVEDIVDRRVSSLSTTSGCSDCTTATLQGAKSYGSSFFSGKPGLDNFFYTQYAEIILNEISITFNETFMR